MPAKTILGPRDVLEEKGGGRTQKFVYQKRPNTSFPGFPMANFVFSMMVTLVEGGGGYPPFLLRCTAILMLLCWAQKALGRDPGAWGA